MRVALVENSGEAFGGGQRSFLSLLRSLPPHIAAVVVAPSDGSFASEARTMATTHIVPMPHISIKNGAKILSSISSMAQCLASNTINIVHANGSRCMFYAGMAAKSLGIPVIWHVRIAEHDGAWDRILYTLADMVIVNSRYTRERFTGFPNAAKKVRLAYNGVDLTSFAPRPKSGELLRSLGIPQESIVIGNVARFVGFKGWPAFIAVAKSMRERNPSLHFVCIGDGPDLLEIKSQAKDLGEHIHFVGFQSKPAPYLNLCDILFFSSQGEPFGRTVIEAMACGVPVVAFRSGGVVESIEHGKTGFLGTTAGNGECIDFLQRLIDDADLRKKLGAAGMHRATAVFSAERHATRITELYDALAASR